MFNKYDHNEHHMLFNRNNAKLITLLQYLPFRKQESQKDISKFDYKICKTCLLRE